MPLPTKKSCSVFSKKLLSWHFTKNDRQMPWKGEKDPYRIWLSEIILQQTRVEQGWKYYESFVRGFPDIHSLAAASDEKVFKLWEGLGYYSRCRNLIHTARQISVRYQGKFPDNYEDILRLKGVGPYTAAAISSFAFGLPYAVVDGNVTRILARIFGMEETPQSSSGKKKFESLASMLLDKENPSAFNQAIMDFGATVCKPALPLCNTCIFKKECIAFNTGRVAELPVKAKKAPTRERWFYFLVYRHRNRIAIRQRSAGDIWQNLYEFAHHESPARIPLKQVNSRLAKENFLAAGITTLSSSNLKQQLTHQRIHGTFLLAKVKDPGTIPAGLSWVSRTQLRMLPFPRMIRQYIEETDPLA
jgi:A/G-specific adenine glycosylase